jgi:hypothetical protein
MNGVATVTIADWLVSFYTSDEKAGKWQKQKRHISKDSQRKRSKKNHKMTRSTGKLTRN